MFYQNIAMLGTWEIIALLFLALLLFGAKKLPELARSLGKSMKEFKKATKDVTDEFKEAGDEVKEIKNAVNDTDASSKEGEGGPGKPAG